MGGGGGPVKETDGLPSVWREGMPLATQASPHLSSSPPALAHRVAPPGTTVCGSGTGVGVVPLVPLVRQDCYMEAVSGVGSPS